MTLLVLRHNYNFSYALFLLSAPEGWHETEGIHLTTAQGHTGSLRNAKIPLEDSAASAQATPGTS